MELTKTNFNSNSLFFSDHVSSPKNSLLKILATESFAVLRHVLPASISWIWRKSITQDIRTIPLQVTIEKVTKVAYLNIHGTLSSMQKNQKITPVLLCHGDFGHPYSMLHLSDLAQKKGLPTFSLYIPDIHKNTDNEMHDLILRKAIDKIEELVRTKKGEFLGILGTGHSKGAILLAQRQFVVLDTRIKAVCSIAGRLNAEGKEDGEHEGLRKLVKKIYQAIIRNPHLPLVQIVPKEDWNAPQESMVARPNDHAYSVPGMHLSGLYSRETKDLFSGFLEEFS